MKRVRVRSEGRVQGVVFREYTRRRAAELGVKGFVRNCDDGCVEAVFEGLPRSVAEAIEWMHTGPPLASVKSVEVTEEPPTGEFSSFSIR
jgi:acylphosphatase